VADVQDALQRIGGLGALFSVWALTTVPAGFSVYILRNIFAERWPGTDLGFFVESAAGTAALWFALTLLFTAWGLGGRRRRA
jgi:hypothetical protein